MAAKSLQEQLLNAGVVDKKKANKIKAEKLQKKQKIKTGKAVAEDDGKEEALRRQRAEKAEKDRLLNQVKQEEQNRKAIQAQIRQMIEMNKLTREEGDIAYNFTDNKKIKKLYMDQDMYNGLSKGRLAIVKLDEEYQVIPQPVAEKIRQRDESYILVCNDLQAIEEDEDDPYADFKIPDDLMW